MKYSRIRSNLGTVAAIYHGRDSYLELIKKHYAEEISLHSLDDETLKKSNDIYPSFTFWQRSQWF